MVADLDRRVAAAQARGPRDPRARLRALIGACLTAAVEDRELWIVFVEFWGQMMHDRRLGGVNAALSARMRRLIGGLVAQGSRARLFRRLRPEHTGAVILALVDGLSLQLTFDPRAFSVATAARLGQEAAMRYLGR